MRRFIPRAKIIVLFILIIAITATIHFTAQPRTQLTWIEQTVRDLIFPLQTGLTRINRSVESLFTSVTQLGSIREEHQALESQVIELQQQLYQMAEYERENRWLREALEFKEQEPYPILVSEVIGRSPTNLLGSITINRGSHHGVTPGMAIMTGLGTVGTVHSVSSRTATVILCTDSRSAVGGMVQDSGDLVLVEGDPENSGLLLAKPLSKDVELNIGDVLVTSGLSQLFPKGMPIGRITEIVPSRYELSFIAYVQPFVDFARLEYVFVVIKDGEQE